MGEEDERKGIYRDTLLKTLYSVYVVSLRMGRGTAHR